MHAGSHGKGRSYFSFFPSHGTPRAPQPNPQSSLIPKKHLNSDWVRVWEFARRLLNRGFLKLSPQCGRNLYRGQNVSLYLQEFIVHNNSNGKLEVLRGSHLTTELNLA